MRVQILTRLVVAALLAAAAAGALLEAQSGAGNLRPRIGQRGTNQPPANQPPSLVVVSYDEGVTGATATASGTAFDELTVDEVTCTVNTGASCIVTGTTTWSAAIGTMTPLSSGANVVTFIATDNDGADSTPVQRTITRSGTDSTAPVVTITGPPGDPYETTNPTIVVNGTATDAVGVTAVECKLTTSGTWLLASSSSYGQASINWTRNIASVPVGSGTIECRGRDAATNTSTPVTLNYVRSVDANAPTIEVTALSSNGVSVMDGGTITANDIDITWEAGDNLGVREVRLTTEDANHPIQARDGARIYNDSNPDQTSVVRTTNNIRPKIGTATYYLHVYDGNYQNTANASFTLTYVPPMVDVATPGMPNARTGTAYSFPLRADGGDGDYSFDNGSGGSSLGGGACTNLTITTVDDPDAPVDMGLVSGTPNTTGTCAVSVRACDGQMTPSCVTINRTLTVQSGALVDPWAHYATLAARPEVVHAYRLDQAADETALAVNGSGYAHFVPEAGIGMRLNMPPRDPGQGSYSIPGQLRIQNMNLTTGNVYLIFQVRFGYSSRGHGCWGGVMNSVFAGAQTHKEWNFTFDTVADPEAEGSIFVEFQTLYDNSTTDCGTNGTMGFRWYGNGQQSDGTTGIKGETPVPCGIVGCLPANNKVTGLQYRPDTWYLFVCEARVNKVAADFTDWNAFIGGTLVDPTNRGFHMITCSVWSEWEPAPKYITYRVPHERSKSHNPGPYIPKDRARGFWLEHNTSTSQGGIFGNMVIWTRSLVVLHNYTVSGDFLTDPVLQARPTR